MFTNYLRTASRILRKHAGYALINTSGLAIGMAACLLMVLFVRHELSYDRFHDSADLIHRIILDVNAGETSYRLADAPAPVSAAAAEQIPEIDTAVRFKKAGKAVVASDERRFESDGFLYVEPEFLEVFAFPLLEGDAKSDLRDPNTLLLTRSEAHRLFGSDDPVGRILTVNDRHDFTVTGVLEDPPPNTHFEFSILASFSSLESIEPQQLEEWGNVANYYHYIRLRPGADPEIVSAKLSGLLEGHVPTDFFSLDLQPLLDIHLRSDRGNELAKNGDITYVYLFSGIAVFILLLACINFMNLATARASTRAREVGMRKVLGARRSQLAVQFLGESLLTALFSLVLALGLVELFLPVVNKLTDRTLSLGLLSTPELIAGLGALVLFVGLTAGSYPALVLSAFRPVRVLKGTGGMDSGRTFRKVLVVGQFVVSIILLVGVMVVEKQLDFIRERKLGFDEEQMLVIELHEDELQMQYDRLKQSLLEESVVVDVAASSGIPTGSFSAYFAQPEGSSEDQPVVLPLFMTDFDFIDTYGLEVHEGRTFSEDRPGDAETGIVVNRTAVQRFGWSDPVGRTIQLSGFDEPSVVLGVVEDFHFMSLHEAMRPVGLSVGGNAYTYLSVRLRPGNAADAMDRIERVWSEFAPGFPMTATFLDDGLNELYVGERRLGRAISWFTGLAILIACLGLFGLAAFTAERRTREIGVRKVMGASVPGIIVLLTREFASLVAIAFAVAAPIAYVALDRWLNNFAYRTELGVGVFAFAAASVLVVATLTVGYQSVRAALRNPVESLGYE